MELEKIMEHCKAIQDFLESNSDPYVKVVVSSSGVKLERVEEFIPCDSDGIKDSQESSSTFPLENSKPTCELVEE